MADDPEQMLELKAFHGVVINDREVIDKEKRAWVPLPLVREVDSATIKQNYYRVKKEVKELVDDEVRKIIDDPDLVGLVVK